MTQLQYTRLCHLIHDSLHPLTVKSTLSLTQEQEKSLLITLSHVLNKIKLWTAEFHSDSSSDEDNNGNEMMEVLKCHSSDCHCIVKIINDLVFLLAVESRFVQHLAANVLVSVSEFVVASGSYWLEFMWSLCLHFEIMMCKVVSPSSDPPVGFKHPECDLTDFTLDGQRVFDNGTWYTTGSVVLVLRTILKQLKQGDDDKILEVYFQVLGSCLQVILWDSCNTGLIDEECMSGVSWFEFCGYLVQLFCTLADCEDENPAVRAVFNIFPKVLSLFFGSQGENQNSSICQYIRHKTLVLMIRLTSLINLDCDALVSWLDLINKYFHDLLSESVSEPEADQDDCLKDSPFNGTSRRHLQRRVIFLYIKCAFSLIGSKENSKKQCSCGNMNSCSKKGSTALFEWLNKHLPANIIDNHELYDDCCESFTKSFIQLYVHEDDMLFKVLLQLTYNPFEYTQQTNEDCIPVLVEKEIIFLLSDIFDPVRLFHLFLSKLHYDHQVLLDYLISKDSGASCAEYLLRCLRLICCDKWEPFLKFPFWVEAERQSFPKRRKFGNIKSSEPVFCKARDCLLLLKKSIKSLHQKDLFPYNPQVLLRRLTRFQELCLRNGD